MPIKLQDTLPTTLASLTATLYARQAIDLSYNDKAPREKCASDILVGLQA